MNESLWPARHVAEYAYCPRLFYLMEVEGIFIGNEDTEKGSAVHARVDKPSAIRKTKRMHDEKPQRVRSLVLTSHALQLTATLDLAEIVGNRATPVEYRKGRPKRVGHQQHIEELTDLPKQPMVDVEPWPSDRIQLGLQALLLEEAGYVVHEAVLYYAQEKRRITIVVDSALKQEALNTLEQAKLCAQGPRPLPLFNDSKCVRCSLQPICLPDEVHYQRAQASVVAPRKLWPLREDGIHIVAQQHAMKIGIRGKELVLKNKHGEEVDSFPLVSVDSLALLGPVQLSTQALHVLAQEHIPVAYLSSAGRLIAMLDPLDAVSAHVKKSQMIKLEQHGLDLARALVVSKITNQRTLLMRNHRNLPEEVPRLLLREAECATMASTIDSVRGHEGQAAAIYFKHFSGMLKESFGEEFLNYGRQRRPPPDPVNACLSLAYTMLAHDCVAALRLARLEPAIGALHVSRPGRPALALDLMEPFRSLISDSVVLQCLNKGMLSEGHFMRTESGCLLTEAGRKIFFMALGKRMDVLVTHPVFGYRLSYRRMLGLHARMLAAWCVNDIETLSFMTTR